MLNLLWKDCNLPWYSFDLSSAPTQPNFDKTISKKFPEHHKRGNLANIEQRKALADKVVEWYNAQPEVIEWRAKYFEWQEVENAKSFTGLGLNIPGTFIVIDTENGEKTLLIGHINTNAGTCDDCREFPSDAIIKRYAMIDFDE